MTTTASLRNTGLVSYHKTTRSDLLLPGSSHPPIRTSKNTHILLTAHEHLARGILKFLFVHTRFIGGKPTASWGKIGKEQGLLNLAQGLEDLVIPQIELPKTLGSELQSFSALTRLECLNSGFYPGKQLSNLQVRDATAIQTRI